MRVLALDHVYLAAHSGEFLFELCDRRITNGGTTIMVIVGGVNGSRAAIMVRGVGIVIDRDVVCVEVGVPGRGMRR